MLLINDDNYFEDEPGDGVYDDPKEPEDGDDDEEKRNVWEVNGEVGGEQVIGGRREYPLDHNHQNHRH